jgi:hypothetical protein
MFESIFNGIGELFSDVLPGQFCWSCFFSGLVEGLALGFVALAVIAAAPAWLAVALAVGLAALGAYALMQLAANWNAMSDGEKSHALGSIAGGLIAGRFGPTIPLKPMTIPGVLWLQTPEGMVPVLVAGSSAVDLAPAATPLAMSAAATAGGGGGGGVTPEEQKALDELGEVRGKKESEIEQKLKDQGYEGPAEGDNGGKIYTKDLGNGKTVAVRLDPPSTKTSKGFADEVPHAHKETLPTSEVSDGNYSHRANGKMTFDDAGRPSNDPRAIHIEISK